MLTKLVESISTDRNLEKIGVSFVATGEAPYSYAMLRMFVL
jgi:hypothetical protein